MFCMGNRIAKHTGHANTGWLAFPFLEEPKLIHLTLWQSHSLNLLVLLLLPSGVSTFGQKPFEAVLLQAEYKF